MKAFNTRLKRIERGRMVRRHPDAELIDILREHYPDISDEPTADELRAIIENEERLCNAAT